MCAPRATLHPRATTAGGATATARRGGITVTVGLPHPSKMLQIPAVSLVAEERTLRGSYLGSSIPSVDIPRYIDLYLQNRLKLDELVSNRIPLTEVASGLEELHTGKVARSVVMFD